MTRWWKVSAGRLQPGHPSPCPPAFGSLPPKATAASTAPSTWSRWCLRSAWGLGWGLLLRALHPGCSVSRPAPRWPGEEVV